MARERAGVIDEGRCSPTAWALPLKKRLRHVPVGSSATKLPQSRGDVEGGGMSPSGTSVWTGRALQVGYDGLEIVGLAHLYSAL